MEALGVVNVQHNESISEMFKASVSVLLEHDITAARAVQTILSENEVTTLLSKQPIWMAPSLAGTMAAETPPSIDYFLALPPLLTWDNEVLKSGFAVYVRCYHNEETDTWKIYVGSGASTESGAMNRVKDYEYRRLYKMATHVRNALLEGYKLVQLGLLAFVECDLASRTFEVRAILLAMEADFTFRFWALHRGERSKDHNEHYLRRMCPWDIEDFSYTGLGSHSPLMDFRVDLPVPVATRSQLTSKGRVQNNAIENGELKFEDLSVQEQKYVTRVRTENEQQRQRNAIQGESAEVSKRKIARIKLGRETVTKIKAGDTSVDINDPETKKLIQRGETVLKREARTKERRAVVSGCVKLYARHMAGDPSIDLQDPAVQEQLRIGKKGREDMDVRNEKTRERIRKRKRAVVDEEESADEEST